MKLHSLARYSSARIQIEDWKTLEIVDRDGKKYIVQGYVKDEQGRLSCPVDVCKGACCRTADIYEGRVGTGPCRFLNEKHQCDMHGAFKPISCAVWPVSPLDIESVNEKLERLGIKERCQLKLVEVE
jgi:hypothetical protein